MNRDRLRRYVAQLSVVLVAAPVSAQEQVWIGAAFLGRLTEEWAVSESSVFPRDERVPSGLLSAAVRVGADLPGRLSVFGGYEYVPHKDSFAGSDFDLSGHLVSIGAGLELPEDRGVHGTLEVSFGLVEMRGRWAGPRLTGRAPVVDGRLSIDPWPAGRTRLRAFLGYRYARVGKSTLDGEPSWPSPDIDFGGVLLGVSVDRVLLEAN